MSDDSRHDPLYDGGPDPELDRLSALLGGLRSEAPLPALPDRAAPSPRRAPWRWVAPVAMAAGLLLGLGWWARGPSPTSLGYDEADALRAEAAGAWAVDTLEGPELCDGPCALSTGEWLETSADQEALLTVADIGWMRVAPETRLRLVRTGPEEHRLELAWGAVSASVVAPPRLLVVDTPSARAVDLGCAYTLAVDARGVGGLRVDSGWVALQADGPEVIVPAGLAAPITAGGPGLPRRVDAPEALAAALDRWQLSRSEDDLQALLTLSGVEDSLSLWHVLRLAPPGQRGAVLDRLEGLLGPLPERAALLSLSEAPLRELLHRSAARWGAPPP